MVKQKKQNYSKDEKDEFSIYVKNLHKYATKFIIRRLNDLPVFDSRFHKETDIYCFILSLLDLFGEEKGFETTKELWR